MLQSHNMKKLLTFLCLAIALATAGPALADEEVRNLELDLQLKGFADSTWQNNLESDKVLFGPNDKFEVRVTLKNQGNRTQTQIKITPTIPGTVTIDGSPSYTINQLSPGQEFSQTFTVRIRDKAYINQSITKSGLKFQAKSEIGTESQDWAYFYTGNGTKNLQPKTSTSTLPATGSNLIFGSILATSLAFAGLKLRRLARGY